MYVKEIILFVSSRDDGICQCCKCQKNREKVEPSTKRRKVGEYPVIPIPEPDVLEIANSDFPSFDVAHIALAKRVRKEGYKLVKGNFLRTDRYTGRTFWCSGKDGSGKRCAYTVTFRLQEESSGFRLSDHDSLQKSHTCVTGTFTKEDCDKYIAHMIQKYNLNPIADQGGSFDEIVQSEQEASLRVPVQPFPTANTTMSNNHHNLARNISSMTSSPPSPTPSQQDSSSMDNGDGNLDTATYYHSAGASRPATSSSSSSSMNQTNDALSRVNSHGQLMAPTGYSLPPSATMATKSSPDLAAAGLLMDFFFHSHPSNATTTTNNMDDPSLHENIDARDNKGEGGIQLPADTGAIESKDF